MNHTTLIIADLLLALGMTMRVTRFIVTDDLGGWMIRHPLHRWLLSTGDWRGVPEQKRALPYYDDFIITGWPWQEKLTRLFHCPYCMGFWVAGAVLLSLWAAGGPGDAWEPWRWFAGWWTLAYIGPHIGARLGDTDGDDNS